MAKDEETVIEELAEKAEIATNEDYERKDQKERRGVTKQMLYDGPRKLKHTRPRGMRS
jgi:hypothetical protein